MFSVALCSVKVAVHAQYDSKEEIDNHQPLVSCLIPVQMPPKREILASPLKISLLNQNSRLIILKLLESRAESWSPHQREPFQSLRY